MLQQYLPLAVLKPAQNMDLNTDVLRELQQYLPLAVLKRWFISFRKFQFNIVATVLTACGIETTNVPQKISAYLMVATVLTACGIETK